jgi:DNA-binding CsgD family transcriptional regulator
VGTGDRRQARAAADAVRAMLGESLVGNLARLTLGFVAAAGGDDRAAMDILAPAYDALARGEPALATPEDPTDEPWLVRFALRAGDRERAEAAALAAERRAACTPGVPSFTAAAAHARALLERDPAGLRRAVAQYRESPRRLGLAWALEDTGRELARRSRRQEAIRHLDEALRVYGDSGAAVDAARVRGRLRGLGVRRRRTAPTRPTNGWAALTASELDVVRVIATGATNRQAAERLFISPHTVSTHLRHAFTKLGINSRVELARISAQAELLAA